MGVIARLLLVGIVGSVALFNVGTAAAQNATRINSGGSGFTDGSGNVWSADNFFTDGIADASSWAHITFTGISDSTLQQLYRSNRFGASVSYAVPVSNGYYTVSLHFAEGYWTQPGQRVYNVDLEGVQKDTIDAIAMAGFGVAITRTYNCINVADGVMNINLIPVVDWPVINGIEIVPATNCPTATAGTVAAPVQNKIIFRFPKSQAGWYQANLSPPGSYVFPIFAASLQPYDYSAPSPLIGQNIAATQQLGINVLGFVYTSDASGNNYSAEQLESWIETWYATFPTLNGIYLGAVMDISSTAFWVEISSYIKSNHPNAIVILNPAAAVNATDQERINIMNSMFAANRPSFDVMSMYESYLPFSGSSPILPLLPTYWMTNYPASRFCAFANGITSSVLSNVESYFLAEHVGNLYLTDVDYGETDTSSFWSQEVAALE
jgi:hypothetical protein